MEPLTGEVRNTHSTPPLGCVRDCALPRPSGLRAIGKDTPGFPLQDSDEVDCPQIVIVLIPLGIGELYLIILQTTKCWWLLPGTVYLTIVLVGTENPKRKASIQEEDQEPCQSSKIKLP